MSSDLKIPVDFKCHFFLISSKLLNVVWLAKHFLQWRCNLFSDHSFFELWPTFRGRDLLFSSRQQDERQTDPMSHSHVLHAAAMLLQQKWFFKLHHNLQDIGIWTYATWISYSMRLHFSSPAETWSLLVFTVNKNLKPSFPWKAAGYQPSLSSFYDERNILDKPWK